MNRDKFTNQPHFDAILTVYKHHDTPGYGSVVSRVPEVAYIRSVKIGAISRPYALEAARKAAECERTWKANRYKGRINVEKKDDPYVALLLL